MLASHTYEINDLAAVCQERIERKLHEYNIGRVLFDICTMLPQNQAHLIGFRSPQQGRFLYQGGKRHICGFYLLPRVSQPL